MWGRGGKALFHFCILQYRNKGQRLIPLIQEVEQPALGASQYIFAPVGEAL